MQQNNIRIEHQKIVNVLNDANESKFVITKWNIINHNSNANYNAADEITYNTEVLKANLCDYKDAYVLVLGDITVIGASQTQVAFKNCAPLTKCITKISETTIDNAENFDLVIPMYNLIEYSSNYSEKTSFMILFKRWSNYF